jgi:hypothetical protein
MTHMDAGRLTNVLTDPRLAVRALVKRSPNAPFERRLEWDALDRPHYAYCTYHAARLAKALGLDAVSVVELGVAGGNGLVLLEHLAATVAEVVGIRIETFGFDAGTGMPAPSDYRDLAYVWRPGLFAMDEDALRRRLRSARLVIGDVASTIPAFVDEGGYPPIGFVAFDLDYWSSTVAAMRLLDGPAELRLPRVFCYFDDIIGDDWEIHCPYVGELLAIEEFNASHDHIKVSPINGLRHKRRIPAAWNDQIYVAHDFAHAQYNTNVHPAGWDLRLRERR